MWQMCFSIKLAFPSDFSSQIARPTSPPPRSPSALSPQHPFCSLLHRAPLRFCDQQGSQPTLPAWEPHVGDGLQCDWFDGGPYDLSQATETQTQDFRLSCQARGLVPFAIRL